MIFAVAQDFFMESYNLAPEITLLVSGSYIYVVVLTILVSIGSQSISRSTPCMTHMSKWHAPSWFLLIGGNFSRLSGDDLGIAGASGGMKTSCQNGLITHHFNFTRRDVICIYDLNLVLAYQLTLWLLLLLYPPHSVRLRKNAGSCRSRSSPPPSPWLNFVHHNVPLVHRTGYEEDEIDDDEEEYSLEGVVEYGFEDGENKSTTTAETENQTQTQETLEKMVEVLTRIEKQTMLDLTFLAKNPVIER